MSPPRSIRDTAQQEAEAMVRYLLAAGGKCPAAVVETLEGARHGGAPDAKALMAAHAQLARLVAPATPASILLLDQVQREDGRWSSLGPVKLVRQMMAVAIVSMVLFVGLSLFRSVGAGTVDILHSSGGQLLLNELFWMAAAGLGASFAMLFQVNQYITSRTYDPTYAPSYWIKFLLGVIAGFILVTLVPLPEPDPAAAAAPRVENLSRPLIAMLGGFSASAVYAILSRLVEGVESLFAGSAREQGALREAQAVQRVSGEAAEARLAAAGMLVKVQQQISAGGSADEAARMLQEVIEGMVGGQGPAPEAPAATEPPARVPALAVVGEQGVDGATRDGEEPAQG